MTYREFVLRVKAFERLESKEWERFRWLGLKVLEPYLEKNSKVTVYDLMRLSTDPTEEELKQMQEERQKVTGLKLQELKEKLRLKGFNV